MAVEKVRPEPRAPRYANRFTRSPERTAETVIEDTIAHKIEQNESRELNLSSVQTKEPMNTRNDISIINRETRYEVVYTDIDKIKAYANQSRTHFDESELLALSKTIAEHGIRQPLTVISTDDGFQVVSGERRLRAAKLVGLRKIPVIIINDDKKAEELALIENIQRKDLHPIELGKAYAKITTRTKENVADIADRISVPVNQVYEYISYSKIPDDLSDLIIKHNLGRRAFLRELLKHNSEEMREIIKEEVIMKEEFGGRLTSLNSQVEIKEDGDKSPIIKGRSLNSNFNLVTLKLKNGKLDVQESGLLKCPKEDLSKIKSELERIIGLIDKL